MTALLLAPWRWFVELWTKPIRAESLAAFRILLAATILASQLTGLATQLTTACGPDPLIPPETRDSWLERSGRTCLLRGPVSLPLLGTWLTDDIFGDRYRDTRDQLQNWVSKENAKGWAAWASRPANLYMLYGVYLLTLVCVMIGFRTRLMTLAALLLATSFNHRMAELLNGGDSLFLNGLYFLLLSPAGAVWSVDAWTRERWRRWRGLPPREGPVFIEPWSVRLMQIQVACMYLFTGLVKLSDLHPDPAWGWWWPRGDWVDGMALYWVMNDVAITRWSYAQVPVPILVCKLLTWGTLFFEIFFWLLVMIRPLRPFVLLMGVGLHIGILITMEIGWFSQVALCWYVLFVSGERVAAWVAWWAGKPQPQAQPEAAPAEKTEPDSTPAAEGAYTGAA